MDLVTQGLLGSTVAQATFGDKIGKKAAFYGFILGLLPDFDIISRYWGEWASMQYHRGPTHSLPILILLTIPIAFFFKWLTKSKATLGSWIGLSFGCLITHPILDWCTTYGTPLFWPFTSTRYANDSLAIIDPLYSLPLLIVTIIGLFCFFTPRKRKILAIAALTISTIYAYSGYINSQELIKKGEAIFSTNGFKPIETRATPTLFNNRLFRIIAKNNEQNYMVTYMKVRIDKPLITPILIKSYKGKEVDVVLKHKYGNLFKWFTMNMICPVVVNNNNRTKSVILKDMRYGFMTSPYASLFSASAIVNKNNKVLSISRKSRTNRPNFKIELQKMASYFF